MLTLRCARCKRKLLRYDKVGEGRLLRCHKTRITRVFEAVLEGHHLTCPCGGLIGTDEGNWIAVVGGSVVTTGTRSS
jgi:hypothetical protein